ncbi:low-density lipoprotein receptor-related protein-like [Sitophilus oryzae]|uniref:Low-density lipoprotein receptor-related protein-like n=1 Tax=Sitophilus oryzae TaxID=7048 RepID=A0A6J2XX32_SITOR|nr:low-density lipoprotein receptor-related protein-like [Sitophilus oryzae]
MILQPSNVELTKVYWYDKNKRAQNMSVSTISREVYQNSFNKNAIIKKNIFGQRWVLKINEVEVLKKKESVKWKTYAYIFVFCSLVLAVGCGIFFSFDHNIFRTENRATPNDTNIIIYDENDVKNNRSGRNEFFQAQMSNITEESTVQKPSENIKQLPTNVTKFYCINCTEEEICMKTEETAKPKCIKVQDRRDPTGCGGLCKINIEYCKNLDKTKQVFQCLPLKTLLKCPENTFNCGNMCIGLEMRCDGQNDCMEMVDEKNCDCELNTHFQCGNETSCLEKNKMCDGKVDCWDKSDEIDCRKRVRCQENHIPCLDDQCIPKEKLCDGVFDCHDKSDEPIWCQRVKWL